MKALPRWMVSIRADVLSPNSTYELVLNKVPKGFPTVKEAMTVFTDENGAIEMIKDEGSAFVATQLTESQRENLAMSGILEEEGLLPDAAFDSPPAPEEDSWEE